MGKIKEYMMGQHTDDTDYGYQVPMPEVNDKPFMATWVDRIIDGETVLPCEEEEDYHAEPDDDNDTSDNYPEGWDESDLNY